MDMRNVGGTPGGTRTFLLGLVMLIAGGYLLFDHVQVGGGFWHWGFGGRNTSFGITLIPLLLGVGILFVNGSSFIGRFLVGGGLLVILVGIIANLDIRFHQTSLFNMLVMLVLIVGGLGLIIRSVMPMQRQSDRRRGDDSED
jgi:hypothetical protein